MQTQDSSEGWPDGIEVIDAYFEAIGGRDAIRKLENRVTKGSLRLWEDASGGSFEIYQEPPGNSYMKVQFGERRAREVWTSGDVAWAKRGRRGIRVLGGSQKAVALRGASLDPLLDWEDHFEKAETAGVESVGDAICHKVVLTPAQGRPMTCWFDRDSRLLVQTKQLDEASFSTQTRQYSDYRDVDGVLVPHTLEDTQWGLVQRVESVEHDAELPEGIFDVPDEVVRALAELEEAEREGEEAPGTAAIRGREKLLMDFGWRFHYGDFEVHQDTSKAKAHTESPGAAVDFDDSEWRAVNLPHDFVVEGLHTETAAWVKGSLVAGAGWYRRSFRLPRSDEGRRLYLEFEGVYRNCQVYLNGFLAGTNLSGYASFRCDITDFANYGGRNILAVRVDASADEGWWYEGGGVYRHVWLVKTDGLHVAPWGVFVWSDVAEEQPEAAQVNVQTKLLNRRSEAQELTLRSTVWGSDGLEVAQVETALALGEWAEETVEQAVSVPQPALWSVEEPNLYLLTSVILVDGEAVDSVETTFGIRTVRFDPDTGLYLNGKPVKIKGVCCHQDHAGVGVALPDRLHEFRIETLKEMGCNAYRTAHHPHAPAIMDACDRLGMLVLDETRVMSSSPEFRGQLERLVLRDRNHPSVIMWSIGNEEGMVQGTPEGTRLAWTMRQVVRKHDPTRPVTLAMNGGHGRGAFLSVDVHGFNYSVASYDPIHEYFPTKPLVVTESACTPTTRAVYARDEEKGYVSAYDAKGVSWGLSAEDMWKSIASRPFLAGAFVWTGFDYRGETTPYRWPCINSHYGIIDMCGFPKDNYYYYRSWWSSDTVLHLFPHWNWAGREGEVIDVWCHTNVEEVELFLNGRSLGRREVEENSHVEWKVEYEPGTLEAKGYRGDELVASARVETTGEPAAIRVLPDRTAIRADGEDVAVVRVEVLDSEGRLVPTAENQIDFSVGGCGKIIGVGNGNPSSHEPDKAPRRRAWGGLCEVVVQSDMEAGSISLAATSPGLESAEVTIVAERCELRASVPSSVVAPKEMFVRADGDGGEGEEQISVDQLYADTAGIDPGQTSG